jgi:hypothetical protein
MSEVNDVAVLKDCGSYLEYIERRLMGMSVIVRKDNELRIMELTLKAAELDNDPEKVSSIAERFGHELALALQTVDDVRREKGMYDL